MTQALIVAAFEDVPTTTAYVVTVGTFDGVHLGHQSLIGEAQRRASELGVPLLIVTFEPYPAQVLRPESFAGRLTSPEMKRDLLATGANRVIVILPFSKAFAATCAADFITLMTSQVRVAEMWVGEEFALGRDRQGTIPELQRLGGEHDFRVHSQVRTMLDGEIVSSTRIRALITSGLIVEANRLLGREFAIAGTVCEGAKLGRTIGFPTANVQPPEDLVGLADGIYASWARLERESGMRPAMTYIGTRPALNPGPRVIETHLFDFDADIYGRRLETRFVERLRPDANFPSVEELVEQMHRDEAQARAILGEMR